MDAGRPSVEFRHALDAALSAVASFAQDDEPSAEGPGAFNPKLHEAILFMRRFLITYYIPIAFALLVGIVHHSITKWQTRRHLRSKDAAGTASPETVSSASSTLVDEDTAGPKDGSHTEQTPLIRSEYATVPDCGPISRARSHVLAFLMRQPKPIPALTAPSNQLPPNGTTLVIVVYLIVNVFYLLYNAPLSVSLMFAFAARAGSCFAINLPVLYVLAAKNNQPLKWLTGWSYESINIFHRRLGEWMVFLGLLHSVCMVAVWYNILRPMGYGLAWFLTRPVIVTGVAALVCFLVLWATSTGSFREKFYEAFLALHISLQTAALILLFLHNPHAKPYAGAALAVWALDRIASRILVSNRKFIATLEIAEDKETVLLYCDIHLDRSKIGDIRSGWKAGQHVFLTVPGIRWDHAYQAHPFTIASPAPAAHAGGISWPLQLVIRCQDGFSKDLLEYAKFHQHTEIYLDGPYGSSELAQEVLGAERTCLIAGGSGVTVTYPLAWLLHTHGKDTSVISTRTIYRDGKKQFSRVLLDSPGSGEKHAHFWIRQDARNDSWLTMFPSHDASLFGAGAGAGDGGQRTCMNLVDHTFETRSAASNARPDITTEVKSWMRKGDKAGYGLKAHTCIVVSGPDSLVREVRNCAASLVQAGYDVDLHVEKFGW